MSPEDEAKINVLVISHAGWNYTWWSHVTIHFIHFLFDYFETCISVICEALKHTTVHLTHMRFMSSECCVTVDWMSVKSAISSCLT